MESGGGGCEWGKKVVVCGSYSVKQAVPAAGPGQTEGGRGEEE